MEIQMSARLAMYLILALFVLIFFVFPIIAEIVKGGESRSGCASGDLWDCFSLPLKVLGRLVGPVL